MSQLKVPQDLRDYLRERNLTLWMCMHPLTYDYEWTGNGPKRGRADKTRVHVQLTGPGLMEHSPWGYGANVREAVDNALQNSWFRSTQSGITGALARLEIELQSFTSFLGLQRLPLDDDIPF